MASVQVFDALFVEGTGSFADSLKRKHPVPVCVFVLACCWNFLEAGNLDFMFFTSAIRLINSSNWVLPSTIQLICPV